ncbi:MAG: isochorismatase family protein [Firmicutes bacterium]|nr:isochorismatase family protein [Bacillota bacterium]
MQPWQAVDRPWGGTLGLGARPALVVVDLMRGFTDPSLPLGSDLTEVVRQTNQLILEAERRGWPVVLTRIAYPEAIPETVWMRKMPGLRTLVEGSPATEFDPRLIRPDGAHVVTKLHASAFFGTSLHGRLAQAGVDTVVVTGCTTSGCVRATVVDASALGYRPIVVREAVGDRWTDAHLQSLHDMAAKYGDVVGLREILARSADRAREGQGV